MQLKTLRELFARYTDWLRTPDSDIRLHYWTSQAHFQQHWDLQADDLAEMIDRSLQNNTTRRLWKREGWEPKAMTIELARLEPDYMRSALKELFNEDKSLELRLGRFLFYGDELMKMYRKANPRSIQTGHYWEDYEFLFLLLAFRYPHHYAAYHQQAFTKLLTRVLAPNVPVGHDPVRYAKVVRTIHTLMQKEGGLVAAHQGRFRGAWVDPKNLMLVFDFLIWTFQH